MLLHIMGTIYSVSFVAANKVAMIMQNIAFVLLVTNKNIKNGKIPGAFFFATRKHQTRSEFA